MNKFKLLELIKSVVTIMILVIVLAFILGISLRLCLEAFKFAWMIIPISK